VYLSATKRCHSLRRARESLHKSLILFVFFRVLAVHLEEIERAEHRSGAGGMMANKARSGGGLLGAQAAPKLTP
jgi:hypothetical protein